MAESERRTRVFWLSMAVGRGPRLASSSHSFPSEAAQPTRDRDSFDESPSIAGCLAYHGNQSFDIVSVAEGYWLKKSSMSPYEGSMYHNSPLLLSAIGPLLANSHNWLGSVIVSLLFVGSDFIAAMLIRGIGRKLHSSCKQKLDSLKLSKPHKFSGTVDASDIACLLYILNPLTILTCVGSTTSPVENLMVILCLYGACTGVPPLAAFGWVVATHLSLYPVILVIPVILLLGHGTDSSPNNFFKSMLSISYSTNSKRQLSDTTNVQVHMFSWRAVRHFLLWGSFWWSYILLLCSISLAPHGGLLEMFKKTYGFILTVSDLSPNSGILWYFFAEVFNFFRVFFLMVFHGNILFMLFPLALRLNHRPCFLAFIYLTISSMLKSYPSVADASLYLGIMGLFVNELADMRFSFMLVGGFVGIHLLSPVMHNLWIWRGTGNANFYFATGLAYACFQTILIVESVSTMLNHDRKLKKELQRDDKQS